MAAPVGQGAFPVCKVTLPDQGRPEIFDLAKTERRERGAERVRFKMTLESLTHGCDPRGKRLSHGIVAILVEARGRGIAVVEHNVSAAREAGDASHVLVQSIANAFHRGDVF